MTCPLCGSHVSAEVNASLGRTEPLCLSCGSAFLRGVDEGYERALLERDVREVAFRVGQWESERASYAKALAGCPLLSGSHATWRHEIAVVDRYIETCHAWLTRARAALS